MNWEQRIDAGTLAAGIAAAALVAARWDWPSGAGVTLGVGLGVWNYRWLKAGATALTRAASQGGGPARPVIAGTFKFLVRFGLLGLCIFVILMSHLLPIAPVIGGLFAVPFAVLAEAIWQLRHGARAGN